MDLRPPTETKDIEELRQWCLELWEFLRRPAFETLLLIPRSSAPDGQAGLKYYDSDDNKEKTHNGTDYQDTY